jgi:hypothetical protein
MQIADLTYLESIAENEDAISGGVAVGVDAYAGATGNSTYTLTDTNTTARLLPSGISLGMGRGFAAAIGNDPIAGVNVYGEGDKIISRTKVLYFPRRDTTVARGFIFVIDFP